MTRYSPDSRDRVRDAVDMVALVSGKVELRRAGVNSYFGRCPFHDERTASFHVSPDEKLYHCFGCSESGDPFDFVMQTEGLDFKGALESLADRFGIALESESEDPAAAAARSRRERLYSLLTRAATFYERNLWEAAEAAPAREYLLGRGFAEEVLREFRVGWAPDAWDRIRLGSRRAGFSDDELEAAGLVKRSRRDPGRMFDFFRGQIMFPTADARGRVRGFGGRRMEGGGPPQGPKYVNTPDGELYHKREVLYGISLARAAAARSGRMILAEGYTDVIALHQAGVRNAVGIMGTSLTREQVAELVRLVRVVELALDADRAGQQAMLRAAELASGSNLELRVVPLPAGGDPADLLRAEGAEALRARAERSVPFAVFQVERILASADTSSAEGRDRAAAELSPILSSMSPSIQLDELMQKAAARLELSETRLAALARVTGGRSPAGAAAGAGRAAGDARAPVTAPAAVMDDQDARKERAFLVLCAALPEAGERALAREDLDELILHEDLRGAARHLAAHPRNPLEHLPGDGERLARVIADLLERAERAGRAGAASPEQLEHARLVLELSRLERAIRRARVARSGDTAALARERERVRAAMHAAVSRLER